MSKNLSEQEIKLKSEREYKEGFSMPDKSVFKSAKGLNEDVIRGLSAMKNEPEWMLDFRLKAYKIFLEKKMPNWGADLSGINFDEIHYYIKPSDHQEKDWGDVPDEVKQTFERLGVPQAERSFLAGVKAQYDSEIVYGSLIKELEEKGVVFLGTDEALKKYPEIFKEYFGKIIPPADNKFAALNSAVWSGGSFVYVPKGVKVDKPLQAYFRINAANAGQFERTLIIIEEGASAHYVEGCSAPTYSSNSLHSAVVEVVVKKGAHFRYTTIQNWYKNVFNLVTKRAFAYANARMEWVDGNLGSKVTMKYPSVYLMEEGASGEVMSLAFASDDQHQDTGAKMVHLAPNTSSNIISKSVSKGSGRASYRGLIKVIKKAENVKSNVVCDALLLDENSRTDTYPYMKIDNKKVKIGHEASVSKVSQEQLFYLISRGLTEEQASALIVNGFISPIVKQLPMEYAYELNKLIELQMEGSVG
jgi:Fe-S cluster assembly protein SufB